MTIADWHKFQSPTKNNKPNPVFSSIVIISFIPNASMKSSSPVNIHHNLISYLMNNLYRTRHKKKQQIWFIDDAYNNRLLWRMLRIQRLREYQPLLQHEDLMTTDEAW